MRLEIAGVTGAELEPAGGVIDAVAIIDGDAIIKAQRAYRQVQTYAETEVVVVNASIVLFLETV